MQLPFLKLVASLPFLCLTLALPAQENALNLDPTAAPKPVEAVKVDAPSNWRLILVPRALRKPFSKPLVEGGQAYVTLARVLTAEDANTALDEPGDVRPLTTQDLSKFDVDRLEMEKLGREYLEALLIKQPVQYFRDKKGLVEYAAINGADPSIAALLTLPSFYKRFEPVFGPGFRAVAPDQFTIYLFPAAGDTLSQFARPLADQFHDSAYPVSLEIFEVGETGLKVLGELPR